MTEKEMYNLINNQNEQQSNGFAINEKEPANRSGVFALMRKVYTWMTLALVITGVTAYGVAASPTLMMTLMVQAEACSSDWSSLNSPWYSLSQVP